MSTNQKLLARASMVLVAATLTAFSASARIHGPPGAVQLHPAPDIAVAARPVGTVSVTVTVPFVGALPELATEIVYAAPISP